MLERKIITSQGAEYLLSTDNEVIVDWFARAEDTHTDIIIDQINAGMYNQFFNKKDMVVIDAGANIGLFSIYAQDSCKKLVSVEPAPHNFYVLEHLLSPFENISYEMSAVHGENTTIPFYIHSSPTCNSSVVKTDLSIDVDAKTIETIMREHGLDHVDFIKCDIEGSEAVAINDETVGAVADRVDAWLLEIHQTDTETRIWPGNLGENRTAFAQLFQRHGYQTQELLHDQLYAWKA